MKKKFQDWLRKQLGCPDCDGRAAQSKFTVTTFPTGTTWPAYSSNGQSVTYTYQSRGDV